MATTDAYVEYDTGVSIEIPEGYVGLLASRSSISNKDLIMCNGVGVIDSDYRGSIRFRFKITTKEGNAIFANLYSVGERIGQILIVPSPEINMVKTNYTTSTERGSGGFGSTNA